MSVCVTVCACACMCVLAWVRERARACARMCVCVWTCVCACVRARMFVCVLVLISELTSAVWELKSGVPKKKNWKYEQLRNFPIDRLEPLPCTEGMETLSNWEVNRNMYFGFSLKYISAIFVRPKTLGEPSVPSLCGLFKMGLTDTQLFLYISYDKDIECVYRKF
jgi:hypothetical protein